jgi:hypothetical protein
MNRTVGGEKEGSMEQMIVCAVVLMALGWGASVALYRRAVAVQQQVRVDESRIK